MPRAPRRAPSTRGPARRSGRGMLRHPRAAVRRRCRPRRPPCRSSVPSRRGRNPPWSGPRRTAPAPCAAARCRRCRRGRRGSPSRTGPRNARASAAGGRRGRRASSRPLR
eukprot:gene3408-biopygen14285